MRCLNTQVKNQGFRSKPMKNKTYGDWAQSIESYEPFTTFIFYADSSATRSRPNPKPNDNNQICLVTKFAN